MTEKELQEKVNEIRSGMKWFESTIHFEHHSNHNHRMYVTENQAGIINAVFDLLRSLAFQLPFNNYKELSCDDSKPINTLNCGTPVRVRSCRPEHGEKTYFGILLGDVALHISHTTEGGKVTAGHSFYNPAIFIPELKTIVYGCESWWGEIKPEDIDRLITDETIKNCWYVRMLAEIGKVKPDAIQP